MATRWEAGAVPHWCLELDRALAVHPQFVISGNVHDLYPVASPDGPVVRPMLNLLWDVLSNRGAEFLLVYDPIDNLRCHATGELNHGRNLDGVELDQRQLSAVSRQRLSRLIEALTSTQSVRGALVIDYASRLTLQPGHLDAEEHEFFARCEKIARQSRPLWPRSTDLSPYNHVIWLVGRPNDLPGWFTLDNDAVRRLSAGLPDRAARRSVIAATESHFPDSSSLGDDRRAELIDQFTLLTEGMTVRGVLAITEIARGKSFGLERITDAVRAYKVGTSDDPWKQPLVRAQIRDGKARIMTRVKGQLQAIEKTLDILVRSVVGLTGAHAGRSGGRPRGILFFAGPTGVGKTELAKAMTEMLFGDPSAYHRFDMSEFSAEHSEARLIGAPPGYVGHDAGGELVNAVRQRPFSVFLFDEIEKAHPRLLDKFLQILEDGRLTDGRGETVHFSEAVLVFTSNLGMFVTEPNGMRTANVTEADDYSTVSQKLRDAIAHHFRFELQRPELLNRIGDNIVVFDYIRPPVAREILVSMIENVVLRVHDEHNLVLSMSADATTKLEHLCLERLDNGGRGIGNRVETYLVNPLARALFDRPAQAGTDIVINDMREDDGRWEVVLG